MSRTSLLLFLGAWFFFTLFHPGRPMTVDGATTLDTVRAMARGRLAVPESLVTRPGRGGRHYCVYGPLLPVLSLPGYFIGSLLEADSSAPGSREIGWADRFALATNQWVSALLLVLIYRFGLLYGMDAKTAVGSSCLVGISTMVWPYARDFFSQPLAATCLLAGAYALVRYRIDSRTRWMLFGSAAFGLAALTRLDMLVCLPGFALWTMGIVRTSPDEGNRPSWVWATLPLFSCLVLFYLFDVYRWDSGSGASYGHRSFNTPLIDSLPRFFISPELSVFLHNPLLLLAVLMIPLTWRLNRWAWSGVLLCDFVYLIVVAKFQDYHGGVCPGPRYLLSLVGLNLLPLLAGIGEKKISNRMLAIGLVPLALVGILMNGYSAVVDYAHSPSAWTFWMGWFGS